MSFDKGSRVFQDTDKLNINLVSHNALGLGTYQKYYKHKLLEIQANTPDYEILLRIHSGISLGVGW